MAGEDKDYQRARSSAQKRERRQDILSAARAHLAEVGFDGFSMGPLAKRAGLARATLYLYFPTREEVLLELYLESARTWVEGIERSTTPEMSGVEFLEVFYDVSLETPLFMELAPRLAATIEGNVSLESLVAGKRLNMELAQRLCIHIAGLFSLPFEQAVVVSTGLFALIVGSVQVTKRPTLDLDALPEDVRAVILSQDARVLFITNGELLLRGSQS